VQSRAMDAMSDGFSPLGPRPGPRPRTVSSMSAKSWYEDGAAVEDLGPAEGVAMKPMDVAKECPEILADIKPHTKEARTDPVLVSLLAQVRQLSEDCFHEDCLGGCSKRGGWRITLLVSHLPVGAGAVLLGFIVYRLKSDLHILSVAKLAVAEACRRRGYGRQLVLWAVHHVKQMPDIWRIGLASLAESVPFYQHIGFRRIHVITSKSEEDSLFPGQVYMELRMRKGRCGGGGCSGVARCGR